MNYELSLNKYTVFDGNCRGLTWLEMWQGVHTRPGVLRWGAEDLKECSKNKGQRYRLKVKTKTKKRLFFRHCSLWFGGNKPAFQ